MIRKKQITLFLIVFLLLSSCASETPTNTESSTSLNNTALLDETTYNLLSHYHGYLKTSTLRSNIYDIKVYGDETDGVASYVEFSFKFPDSADQSFRYSLENFPHMDSIHQGITILDVNGDNNDDIILDLGENGHQGCAACFIFSPSECQYIAISDFTTLASPKIAFSPNDGLVIISENAPDHLDSPPNNSFGRWSEYKIENSSLMFIASLDDINTLFFIF